MQRRNSLRYPGHDYSEPGAYFATVRVQDGQRLFGVVENGMVKLSDAGAVIQETLLELPFHTPGMALDTFIVMPNHIHVLIFLGIDPGSPSPTLGTVIRRFKSITTNRYANAVQRLGWQRFERRLWQRNFHDHIVRSDRGVARIRDYIEGNPARWQARLDAKDFDTPAQSGN